MVELSDMAKSVLAVFLNSVAVTKGKPLREETIVNRGASREGLIELIKAGLIDPRAHEDGKVDFYLSWGKRTCPRGTYWVQDNGERRDAIIWHWSGFSPGSLPTLTVMLGDDISYARYVYVSDGVLSIGDVPNGGYRSYQITRELH